MFVRRFGVTSMDSITKGRKEVQRAAAWSVMSASFLTVIKLVTGILTNSLGVISEALHSGLDLLAAGITLLAVRRASRAPDSEHQFGHGKIENFAALSETVILWATSFWIIHESLRRIELQEWPEASEWGILVMAIGVIVTYFQSKVLYNAANNHGSQALEADALHFRTDMISSVVVLLGLGFVQLDFPIADPIAAIGVAIIIFVVSYRLGRRTFDALTDRAPEGIQDRITSMVSGVSGVIDCTRVRVRHSGPELFADIVVMVDQNVATSEAHNIAETIEQKLEDLAPRVDVIVHIEPAELDKEHYSEMNIYDQMQVVARRLPEVQSVHNIRVFEISNVLDIAADLEMLSDFTLEDAHAVSERFESGLRELISNINSVTLHLETSLTKDNSADITSKSSDIVESVKKIVTEFSPPIDYKKSTIKRESSGIAVLLDCTIPGNIPLTESHEIAEAIKKKIIETLQVVKTVYIHLDPV